MGSICKCEKKILLYATHYPDKNQSFHNEFPLFGANRVGKLEHLSPQNTPQFDYSMGSKNFDPN